MTDQTELSVQDFFALGNHAAAETAALRARFGGAAAADDDAAPPAQDPIEPR